MTINGANPIRLDLTGDSEGSPSSVVIPVLLKGGKNTIQFGNPDGEAPALLRPPKDRQITVRQVRQKKDQDSSFFDITGIALGLFFSTPGFYRVGAFARVDRVLKIRGHSLQVADNDVVSADVQLFLKGVSRSVGNLFGELFFLDPGQADLFPQFGQARPLAIHGCQPSAVAYCY